MDLKTSSTHPIEIAKLPYGDRSSCIGITLCPGKKGPSTFGGRWDRDLDADLAAIKEDFDPKLIITLMTREELMLSNVSDIGSKVEELGIRWLHLPIEDMAIPGQRFEETWRAERPSILRTLGYGTDYADDQSEGNILIHCRGGLGRSGMLATVILSELGMRNETALGYVRKMRVGAVETKAQEDYAREYIPSIKVPKIFFWPKCFYVMSTTVKFVKDYLDDQRSQFPFHISDCPTDEDPLEFLERRMVHRHEVLQSMDNLVTDFERYMEDIGDQIGKILGTLGISATSFPSTIESWTQWLEADRELPGKKGVLWCDDVRRPFETVFHNPLLLERENLLSIKRSLERIFRYFEEWKLNIEEKEREWNSWRASLNGPYLVYLQTVIEQWYVPDS